MKLVPTERPRYMNAYDPNPRRVVVARWLFENADDADRAAKTLDKLALGHAVAEITIEERA